VPAEKTLKTPTITTLENGIRVIAAPMPDRRSVSAGIWVGVGARHEEPRLSGVSHFLEHIVFKGTKTRTANQIKESIEGVGGSMNAFTSEEHTCFLAKVSNRHFEDVFDVLADMVLAASLTEKDVEKERTVILEEIKMTQDHPGQLADELLSEVLWPEHPLGRPIAGTLESVAGLSRADIEGYRDAHYKPGAITVVAAGDVDTPALARMTRKNFTGGVSAKAPAVTDFKRTQREPRARLHTKATEQTHLSLALHAYPKEHPDEYALDMLNVALGGNMSSRLFNEVREERGLAYDVGSYVRRYHETGALVVSAGVDNKKPKEALEVILKELMKLAREPVTADELRRAKDFYLGQFDLGLENSMNQMLWLGEDALTLGRLRAQDEVRLKTEAVTSSDIHRVARDLFKTASLNLAVVGPSKSEKEFGDLLHFD
jgi:predicted Zn-dependent peptidase